MKSRDRTRILLPALAWVAVTGLAACTAGPGVTSRSASNQGRQWPIGAEQTLVLEGEIGGLGGSRKALDRILGRSAQDLFQRPYGIAWHENDLLVTDPGAGTVYRVSNMALSQKITGIRLGQPMGVAVCPNGVLVTDSSTGQVELFNARLEHVQTVISGLTRPTGVTCQGDRAFIVETGAHRVLLASPSESGRWNIVMTLGERGPALGQFNFPTVVEVQGDRLWVGDTLNFRVQQLDSLTGMGLLEFGVVGDSAGAMPRLKGVAIDLRGRLWITDAYLNQVAIYSADGNFLTAFGGPGAGPAAFSFPAGVAAHEDGRVAIVDSLNRRIQIFRLIESAPEMPANSGNAIYQETPPPGGDSEASP